MPQRADCPVNPASPRSPGGSHLCEMQTREFVVSTPQSRSTAILLLLSTLITGCAKGPLRLQYLWRSDENLSYYVDKASAIEYPTEPEDMYPRDPDLYNRPRSLNDIDEAEPWAISLNECVRRALSESAIVLDDASFGSPSNPIFSRPANVASTLDHAIQNTGFLFGNRGPEAALADFDAAFTTSLTWGRDEVPQNAGSFGIPSGASQVSETFAMQTTLEKPLANGGTLSLQSNLNYDGNNRPVSGGQLFPSSYNGLAQFEMRQPLLAGAGTEFTRIAGPASQTLRGVSGVSQGVLISRINSDISLTQFEQSVQSLVRDVHRVYWDLNLFLRLYESEKESFKELLEYYNRIRQRGESTVASIAAEARIAEAKARLAGSLADVLQREQRLRRLCHLPLSDGRFLYPADKPTEALLEPAWDASLQEALAMRVELRRQKWEIKSLELQLRAARSLTRPRLDFVSQYRVNGLGDALLGNQDSQLDTFLGNLAGGQNTGWSIGFQMSAPLGFRLARIQERNYELRLRKAKVVLAEQERDISYELASAMLEMERWYSLANDTIPRMRASRSHVEFQEARLIGDSFQAQINSANFEALLNAKIQARDAEQAYLQSIVEYNKAVVDWKFRKGTLLRDSEIYLAEGNWHPEAYNTAMKRAVDRTHAKDKHKFRTVPMEFVAGPAPTGYESLNLDGRPSTPGVLQNAMPPGVGPAEPVPGIPDDLEPAPVPPMSEEPVIPAPQDSGDNITQVSNSRLTFPPFSSEEGEQGDDSGRVKL